MFNGELGLQCPLHVLNRYSLPELLHLVEHAWSSLKRFNFTRVWTNDNLEYRNIFVASASIVNRVPVRLGTAVTFPYARNPIDMAGAFAALSELMNGQEISLGIGTGTRSIAGEQVEMIKPVTMVAEILHCLKALLAGQEIRRDEFPALSDYFHLKAKSYRLRFKALAPVRLYYGGFGTPGPRLTRIVGENCDGAIRGTRLTRDIEQNLGIFRAFEKARSDSGIQEPMRKVMIVNASISNDRNAARNHAKRFASHVLCDERDDVLEKIGIDLNTIQPLRRAYASNQGVDVGASLVPDQAIDKVVIAGAPKDCVERIASLFEVAERNHFSQVLIGVPLGPDVNEVIDLWGKTILPAVK